MLLAEQRYDPDRIRFYFRQDTRPPPAFEERIGTAVYTGHSREDLRELVLSDSRAIVIIGGGDTTIAEASVARTQGVPIIPIARSRGAALQIWQRMNLSDSGIELRGTPDETTDWNLLNHDDIGIATMAAVRLVVRAMYLNSAEDRLSVASSRVDS
jgi:hypothetical protein